MEIDANRGILPKQPLYAYRMTLLRIHMRITLNLSFNERVFRHMECKINDISAGPECYQVDLGIGILAKAIRMEWIKQRVFT